LIFTFNGRFGVVVGILVYYARGRGLDSRTVQTFVCLNMSVCNVVCCSCLFEELDGPAASAFRRAIAEVKQRWSAIGWVTKNVLSRAPPCFGRHVKSLVPAAFVVVSTHQPALVPRDGLWPVLLMCNP
jgi:hypothetical protein